MHIVVIGAGEVGREIAANLQASHDVVVIDRDPEVIEDLTYSQDVLAIEGDGTELGTLRQADVERADLVIACTDDDEANIVVCGATKTLSDGFTICRVRRRSLLETWEGSRGAFGVDFMVCTDLLTAQTIYQLSGVPGAQDVDMFAGGLVRMGEFEIGPESPVAGSTVSEADRYASLTFASVFRDDEMIVATGETEIRAGDRIVVLGTPGSVRSFADDVALPTREEPEEVVIVGGSEVGFQVAREFEDHGYRPRLIEQDHERAREIAEALPRTVVMQNDETDADFLEREHVDEADLVVATLDSDERNLLVSLLADRIGVERTVAVIENTEYVDLFETVGVDVAVNPREETAEEIVRFTRADHTEKVAMLEHDRAEVIEIEINRESPLADRRITDVTAEFPDGVVIGAISRQGDLVTPRGETVFQPGDHVVLFVDAVVLDEVVGLV